MKNWLPFVLGPLYNKKEDNKMIIELTVVRLVLQLREYLLAMDSMPAPVCFSSGLNSSSNVGLFRYTAENLQQVQKYRQVVCVVHALRVGTIPID